MAKLVRPEDRRGRPARKQQASPDVVSLVSGVLLTAIAAGSLWIAFGGHLDSRVLGIAVPSFLVVIGVLGLALSRGRS